MIEWGIAFLVFGLAFAGLALGVLRGRRGIQGSCGGLNNLPGVESDCGGACGSACKSKRSARDRESESNTGSAEWGMQK